MNLVVHSNLNHGPKISSCDLEEVDNLIINKYRYNDLSKVCLNNYYSLRDRVRASETRLLGSRLSVVCNSTSAEPNRC